MHRLKKRLFVPCHVLGAFSWNSVVWLSVLSPKHKGGSICLWSELLLFCSLLQPAVNTERERRHRRGKFFKLICKFYTIHLIEVCILIQDNHGQNNLNNPPPPPTNVSDGRSDTLGSFIIDKRGVGKGLTVQYIFVQDCI